MRPLLKSISWRIVALSAAVVISFILFGNIGKSLEFGVLDAVICTLLYYLHEIIWDKIYAGSNN